MDLCLENCYNSNAHVTTWVKQRFKEWNWQVDKVRILIEVISLTCDKN